MKLSEMVTMTVGEADTELHPTKQQPVKPYRQKLPQNLNQYSKTLRPVQTKSQIAITSEPQNGAAGMGATPNTRYRKYFGVDKL